MRIKMVLDTDEQGEYINTLEMMLKEGDITRINVVSRNMDKTTIELVSVGSETKKELADKEFVEEIKKQNAYLQELNTRFVKDKGVDLRAFDFMRPGVMLNTRIKMLGIYKKDLAKLCGLNLGIISGAVNERDNMCRNHGKVISDALGRLEKEKFGFELYRMEE